MSVISRIFCKLERNTSTKSRKIPGLTERRLLFESLEDRQLLSATPMEIEDFGPIVVSQDTLSAPVHEDIALASSEAPVVGETFIVDKDTTQTIYGVTYAIANTDTGSLTITVEKYDSVNIVKNDTGDVSGLFVSGKYNGTDTGNIYDKTTLTATITGEIPYYWKVADGNLIIDNGGNVTKGVAGYTGTNVNITIESGGFAQFGYKYVSSGIYYNIANTVTVKEGGSAYGTSSFGNKTKTEVKVEGGTLNWGYNNIASSSSGYVGTFSMTSGSMTLGNGTYNIGSITGGKVTTTGTTATYNFKAAVTGETELALNAFATATFSGSTLPTLSVGTGNLEIPATTTVTNLIVNAGAGVTLKGTATTMTTNDGYSVIASGANVGTLNINGGTVVFPNSFAGVGSYVIAPGKSFIDILNNKIYVNETSETVTTSNPSTDLSSYTTYTINSNAGYYVVSGVAEVDTETWTFKDGTDDNTGTVYCFYGNYGTYEYELPTSWLTLEAGASGQFAGITFTPYSPTEGETPANATFAYTPAIASIAAGTVSMTGAGAIMLGENVEGYANISSADIMKVYLYPSSNNYSTLIYDGLKIYQDYGYGYVDTPATISDKNVFISGNMYQAKISPVSEISTTSSDVENCASMFELHANVNKVIATSGSTYIYSQVQKLEINGQITAGLVTPATITGNGSVETIIITGRADLYLKENSHAGSVDISNAIAGPGGDSNVRVTGSSSLDSITLKAEQNIKLSRGGVITALTLQAGSFLENYSESDDMGYVRKDDLVYTVVAKTEMTGTVSEDGSSTFTLVNKNDCITVNNLNYFANKDNASVYIDLNGNVSLDNVDSEIRINTHITTLNDTVDLTDGLISLREAISYASEHITWTAVEKTNFADGSFGYDFNTGTIVVKADMEDDKLYYTPTGYNGSEKSIESAIIDFDSSLDTEGTVSPTVTLNSELVITKTIAIDGAIGTKTVTLDRGLVKYHEDKFDLIKLCANDADTISATWEDLRSDTSVYSRILDIRTSDIPVVLANMSLTGAYFNTYGGVIYNRADLALVNIDIVGNYILKYPSDSVSCTIYNTGSLNMIGGSLEGNRLTGMGNVFSKNQDDPNTTISFDGVTVRHNMGGNGVFIEPYSQQNIIITDCVIDENIGQLIHTEQPFNLTLKDTVFTNNFKGGRFYFYTGTSTIENCIFDNSGYDVNDVLNNWSNFAPYVGAAGKTDNLTFTNCVFKNYAFAVGKYSSGGNIDLTFNNCTLADCYDINVNNNQGISIVAANYSLNLTLNDSIILGNGFDLYNAQTSDNVVINVTDSVIGYYRDITGKAALTNTNSVIGTEARGAITFVQTTDPELPGYYEAKSAIINDRTFSLLGNLNEDPTKQASVTGYNAKATSDWTMTQIVDQWNAWNTNPEKDAFYTTVTTLDYIVDPTDCLISLLEAQLYIEKNDVTNATITFGPNVLRTGAGAVAANVQNAVMLGWKWSENIEKDAWYFNGTEVVQNTGDEPVAGWTPGTWNGVSTLDQKTVELNISYDINAWKYTTEIPPQSFYFNGENIVQNNNEVDSGINAEGWMPVSWSSGTLTSAQIQDNLDASRWTLTNPTLYSLAIDGAINNDTNVTITCANPLENDVVFVNNGYLTLEDINLQINLYQAGTTPLNINRNVTLLYLTGASSGQQGIIAVQSDAALTIRNYYNTRTAEPNIFADYFIHNRKADAVTVGATDGKIDLPTADLQLKVTSAITTPFYIEDTSGAAVANIEFFENFLPTCNDAGAFTVTRAGEITPIDVTSSFEFILNDTEATGVKVKADTTLDAGTYTVNVTYPGNLSKSATFTVIENVDFTFDQSAGSATPQNKEKQDTLLATGTAENFYNVNFSIDWKNAEQGLSVSDYFKIVPSTGTGSDSVALYYTGGLSAREEAYVVRVTASGQFGKTASADYSLTINTPEISLTPEDGEITIVTQKMKLANVTKQYFTNDVTYSFTLEQGADNVHFSVDNEGQLNYTGDGELQAGNYDLVVTASDGIDSDSALYSLVILENKFNINSIFSSITTNNHDLDLAQLIPVNFPAGNVTYTLSCDKIANIGDYFTVNSNSDRSAYIHYSAGLSVDEYEINVVAECTATNPDDGNVRIENTYNLTVTSPGVTATVVLDPTNRQMETLNAVDGFELASVTLNGFEEVPTIAVTAVNTTTKDPVSGLLMNVDYSDCFTVVDGKLRVSQNNIAKNLISGEYLVSVSAKTYASTVLLQSASAEFTLTLFDKVVEIEEHTNITVDYDTEADKFIVVDTDTKQDIDEDEAKVLVIKVDSNTTPVVTITQSAMNNLDAIHVETAVDNVIVVEAATNPEEQMANHYVISGASDVYDNPTAVTITALDNRTDTQIARTTSSSTKSITIDSGNVPTTYDINSLETNVLITTTNEDVLSFADSTSDKGIVLNLDNQEHFQNVYTGQSGTLKIEQPVAEVVLSSGNDVVTGSSKGSVITDTSKSWNTITLNGTDDTAVNKVTLNSASTITVNGAAENTIEIENGNKAIINLANAQGKNKAEIKGDNVTIAGGTGENEITLNGDFGIINSPSGTSNMTVRLNGNGIIVTTGSGNDTIYINGNDAIISTGMGNDTIFVEGNSKGNIIKTGGGDDIIIADDTTGANTYYSDSGNDFILGGGGADQLFGGTGNSFLAGGRNSDRITGGSGRDIMIANTTSNMTDKTREEILAIRRAIVIDTPWWDNDIDDLLTTIGTSSVSDDASDSISRESTEGIDIFFRNLVDGDIINNALQNDSIFD